MENTGTGWTTAASALRVPLLRDGERRVKYFFLAVFYMSGVLTEIDCLELRAARVLCSYAGS